MHDDSRKNFGPSAGLCCRVGLIIWTGPYITHHGSVGNEAAPTAQATAPGAETEQASPVETKRTPAPRRATAKRAVTAVAPIVMVSASEPDLQQRLKPLLNKGADMSVASQEFRDGAQFAAVAHAARNTDVPFMVLKHRVLDERKSLADAIHEFKPGLDATAEAERARAQAKSDIAAIKG